MIDGCARRRARRRPRPCTCSRTLDEVRAATETVAASGQRLISIMTPDLEPEIYDQPAFLEIIKRFVLGRSFAKVRVLMRDQARLEQRRQSLHRDGASADQLSGDPHARAAVPRAHGRLLHRRRSRHRLSRCAPIAPTASPASTIRRSRASTCRNSMPSGRRARTEEREVRIARR